MRSFDSNLGGQIGGWVGPSGEQSAFPITPLACPACFPSLPQAWEVRTDSKAALPRQVPPGRPEPTTREPTAPGRVTEWKLPPTGARRGRVPFLPRRLAMPNWHERV